MIPRSRIFLTSKARKQLAEVTDQRVLSRLNQTISGLEIDPDKQGKPLTGDLAGLRSIRAVGQRWRILYKVKAEQVEVLVVLLGLRREGDRSDIYALAKRLLRLGLLEPE